MSLATVSASHLVPSRAGEGWYKSSVATFEFPALRIGGCEARERSVGKRVRAKRNVEPQSLNEAFKMIVQRRPNLRTVRMSPLVSLLCST